MKYNNNQKQDGTIDFGVNDVSGINGELFDQSEREQEGDDQNNFKSLSMNSLSKNNSLNLQKLIDKNK